MSRVTPPVTKFAQAVRSISSSAQSAHSSVLLDSTSRYLPRSIRDLKTECSSRKLRTSGSKAELVDRLTAYDLTRQGSTMVAGHRPSPQSQASAFRTVPLMQGFRTSAPKQSAHDSSTIDFFFFPEIPEAPPANPFSKLRVPLLPDNYTPDRSAGTAHAIESVDEAIPRPEILIVASRPEDVLPAAMSEVVGNEGIDISIDDLTKNFKHTSTKELKEPGTLKQLWDGLLDDIFGSKSPKASF